MTRQEGVHVVATNKDAYHHYFILETFECGIVLSGTEVKSIRAGAANLKDSYCQIKSGEAWVVNAHISPYSHGNRGNLESRRTRKLLLHRREIDRLEGKVQEKGLTLVPTKIYFRNGCAKMEIGLAKAKKLYDKRETELRKTVERETRRILKNRNRE